MDRRNRRLRRMVRSAVALAAVGSSMVLTAAPAGADLVITGGAVQWDDAAPTVDDFTPVTLNGMPQLTTLTINPFTVEDSSGANAGWHVLLTVPDLVNGAHTIPATDVTMQAPTLTAIAPAVTAGMATSNDNNTLGTGTKIVIADAGEGQGMYVVSPQPLKVVVPVDALAGTYVSAGTIDVNSGP